MPVFLPKPKIPSNSIGIPDWASTWKMGNVLAHAIFAAVKHTVS